MKTRTWLSEKCDMQAGYGRECNGWATSSVVQCRFTVVCFVQFVLLCKGRLHSSNGIGSRPVEVGWMKMGGRPITIRRAILKM